MREEFKQEPYHRYILEGDFDLHNTLDVFHHLNDVLQGIRHKILVLETGGVLIKTREVIDRETIGLKELNVHLIECPPVDEMRLCEITIFCDKTFTLRDVLEAGMMGAYQVRKWKPNSKTKQPNNGWSIYFYDEHCTAKAWRGDPYLLAGISCESKIATPFSLRRADTDDKGVYWNKRREEFNDILKLKKPLYWKKMKALHDIVLAKLPSNPQHIESVDQRLRALEERLMSIESNQLPAIRHDVSRNAASIEENRQNLERHEDLMLRMASQTEDLNSKMDKMMDMMSKGFAQYKRLNLHPIPTIQQIEARDHIDTQEPRHSYEDHHRSENESIRKTNKLPRRKPRHIKRRSADFWEGQDDIYHLEEKWNEKTKSKKSHHDVKMELDTNTEVKEDHYVLVRGPDNNLIAILSNDYPTIGELRVSMCQRWQCTGSITSNGIAVKDVVAIASFPQGKTLTFSPNIAGGADSPRISDERQSTLHEYFSTRTDREFIPNPEDELNTEEKDSPLNPDAEPFHMPEFHENLQQTTLEESFFPSDTQETKENHVDQDTHAFKVLQWNCYHLTGDKVHYLSQVALHRSIDVILLQEISPVQKTRAPKRIPGFHAPRYIQPQGSKGLAAYVRKGIYWKSSESIFDKFHPRILHQSITLRLEQEDKEIRLDNIYIHNDTTASEKLELWKFLADIESEFHLVMGDINERAAILGGGNENPTSSFDDLISMHGYSIFNSGEATRIQRHGSTWKESAIDMTLGNAAVTEKLSSWSLEDESSSDHRPIITTLNFAMTSSLSRSKVSKVPYEELRRKFKQLYADGQGSAGAKFWSALMTLRDYRPSFVRARSSCKWWSRRLERLRRRRDRARRRRCEIEFVRLRREFRREVKKAKRKYEQRVLNTRASEGVPWKVLKEVFPGIRKKRRIGSGLDSEQAKQQAQELANTYAALTTERAKVEGRQGLEQR